MTETSHLVSRSVILGLINSVVLNFSISSLNPSFSTIEYGLRSTTTILAIAFVIALAFTLSLGKGVLRVSVCSRLSCVVEDDVLVGLQILKWFHKGPFPHDFDFALEFPQLPTLQHLRHVAFEALIGFLMKLSRMFDEGVSVESVRFLFLEVAIDEIVFKPTSQ